MKIFYPPGKTVSGQEQNTLSQSKDPYPSDYEECMDRASREETENARPELNGSVEDFSDYDVIFLGFPNWWSSLPMPVLSFVEQYGSPVLSGLSGSHRLGIFLAYYLRRIHETKNAKKYINAGAGDCCHSTGIINR